MTTESVPATPRLGAIDAQRGLVMVVMALDHVRDFVHVGAMAFSPEDLTRTTPVLFLTRWITHICAPGFVFLAGLAVFRKLRRDGSPGRLSAFLVSRGLWLILAEVVLLRFALNFRLLGPDPILLLVLWAIGVSMIVLALLVHLPTRIVGAAGVVIIALHNRLDPVSAQDLGALALLWTVLGEVASLYPEWEGIDFPRLAQAAKRQRDEVEARRLKSGREALPPPERKPSAT